MTRRRTGPVLARRGKPPRRSAALDLLLGAAAGTAGVRAMDRIGWFLYNREDGDAMARELQARRGGGDVKYTGPEKESLAGQPRAEPAGEDVAHAGVEKIAGITGVKMRTGQPNPAAVALHYALGIVPGALQGAIRRQAPLMQAGSGVRIRTVCDQR